MRICFKSLISFSGHENKGRESGYQEPPEHHVDHDPGPVTVPALPESGFRPGSSPAHSRRTWTVDVRVQRRDGVDADRRVAVVAL